MQDGHGRYSTRVGDLEPRISAALDALDRQRVHVRIWEKDVAIWRQSPEGNRVISNRLGWLNLPETSKSRVDEICAFADEVHAEGFQRAVVIGMGGSSLSPEVSKLAFASKEGRPELLVLDSTVPAAVLDTERLIDPSSTLFIVSTKSGTTVETLSAYRYFYDKIAQLKGHAAGAHFAAITDLGTPLERESSERGFRRLFLNAPDIGGRYSALSYFGLVPAAVIGVDIGELLDRASCMAEECRREVWQNPGVLLGAAIAELARSGRDKMTMIVSPEIAAFGSWVEQLVAESTGKMGRGILPVDGEPSGNPDAYMDDRFFIYLRLKGSKSGFDEQVVPLESSGLPVIRIDLRDVHDIGGEYFRWEMATAVASALLGVNAFDEPNVKESKDITGRLLDEYQSTGRLPEEMPVAEESGVKLLCDDDSHIVLDQIRMRLGLSTPSVSSYLTAYLNECRPGDYLALLAFVHKTPEIHRLLQQVRVALRDRLGAATTLGYGPRFLHSTGQLHKGGPNSGMFIQFTSDDEVDVPIPGAAYGFSTLKQAQATGDAIALQSKGRPFIRVHFGDDPEGGLSRFLKMLAEPSRPSLTVPPTV